MPRHEPRYRPEALADLEFISKLILRLSANSTVARRYVERIRERCRGITLAPLGGRPRDDLLPGLRSVPFEKRAVIVYRVVDGIVEITNIFYGGRDYQALYRRVDPAQE